MATNIQLVKIKAMIDSLIEYIRLDWEEKEGAGVEEESFLYKVLEGNSSDGYDFYKEGKAIFLRTEEHQNKITTRLMFSKDIPETPTITVREPARSKGSFNSIGGMSESSFGYSDGSVSDEYRDTKRADFEIMITSKGNLEVILVSEVIYTLLLSAYETMSNYAGFKLHSLSLKELMANNELVPFPLYIKTITISSESENTVLGINTNQMVNAINFVLSGVYNV